MNPPDNAIVLCEDEKTQIQALEQEHAVIADGAAYRPGRARIITGTGRRRYLRCLTC